MKSEPLYVIVPKAVAEQAGALCQAMGNESLAAGLLNNPPLEMIFEKVNGRMSALIDALCTEGAGPKGRRAVEEALKPYDVRAEMMQARNDDDAESHS